MGAIVYKVKRNSGDYVRGAIVPANHSEEAHFGPLDAVIIGVLLLCAGGLACVFVLG